MPHSHCDGPLYCVTHIGFEALYFQGLTFQYIAHPREGFSPALFGFGLYVTVLPMWRFTERAPDLVHTGIFMLAAVLQKQRRFLRALRVDEAGATAR